MKEFRRSVRTGDPGAGHLARAGGRAHLRELRTYGRQLHGRFHAYNRALRGNRGPTEKHAVVLSHPFQRNLGPPTPEPLPIPSCGSSRLARTIF
jgi:hypothetical protein